jgi:hypothetical protein
VVGNGVRRPAGDEQARAWAVLLADYDGARVDDASASAGAADPM